MSIISLYIEYQDQINLLKDIIFFAGAYKLFTYLANKKFQDSCANINENIRFRKKIEPQLNNFIQDSQIQDICIRFVHWKNYPWNLSNDGFRSLLWINYENNKPCYGWIDNTGVNFEKPLKSNSVYLDKKNGIFFISEKNQNFKNFKEIRCSFIMHLPFKNIVNFDFIEKIEYEPVFYTKYYYTNWKKNYDDLIILRELKGDEYFRYELSQKRMLKKYSLTRYLLLRIKLSVPIKIKNCFNKNSPT